MAAVNSFLVRECENKRGPPEWKPPSFYNPRLEVTSHHFCRILFVRNESINPLMERGLARGVTIRNGVGVSNLEAILETAYFSNHTQHFPNEGSIPSDQRLGLYDFRQEKSDFRDPFPLHWKVRWSRWG